MDDVLLPGLYDVTWYNGQTFEYKEGFITNKQSFLIGMPRLRQLRIKTSKILIIVYIYIGSLMVRRASRRMECDYCKNKLSFRFWF